MHLLRYHKSAQANCSWASCFEATFDKSLCIELCMGP